MYRLGLIGCGTICEYYKYAFKNSENVVLTAMADLKEDCIGRSVYNNKPFYKDYKEMLQKEDINLVFISTNVNSHFEIIKYCLENGFDVIVEKPLCCSMSQVEELYSTADKYSKQLEVLYHFVYGDEIQWLKNNIAKFGKIKRYSFSAHEQYACNEDHIVSEQRRGLGHAWNDASINMLSDIDLLLNLDNVKKTRELIDIDANSNLIRYAHKTFVTKDGVEFDILVDWMTTNKTKISVIDFESGRMIIDHHEEVIYHNGVCVYNNAPKIHRMYKQYENYFKNFEFDKENRSKTIRLHKIIFD